MDVGDHVLYPLHRHSAVLFLVEDVALACYDLMIGVGLSLDGVLVDVAVVVGLGLVLVGLELVVLGEGQLVLPRELEDLERLLFIGSVQLIVLVFELGVSG